jgi:DNA-binding transcriptional LysR family regulator
MAMALTRWQSRIGRRIRLHDLHVLLAVVQQGSMAKAARQLAVSQPAISKAVTDLEYALGVRLLDRSAQGVTPTLYGSALVRRGLAVFDELRQAVGELELIANADTGEVRVGCNDSLAAALFPAVIQKVGAQYPRLVIHLTQMNSPITVEVQRLRDREVDFIVGRGVFPIPERDLDSEVLFEEPLLIVAGARNPWLRRRKLRLAELTAAQWILYPPDVPPGLVVEEAFHAQGVEPPRPAVTASSFHLRQMLLSSGDYLTVVPACMLSVFNATRVTVRPLPVALGIEARPVAVFTLKNRTLNPVAARVIAAVREVAGSL